MVSALDSGSSGRTLAGDIVLCSESNPAPGGGGGEGTGISSGLMGHLTPMQALPLHHHVNSTVSLLLKIDITWSKFFKKLFTTAC